MRFFPIFALLALAPLAFAHDAPSDEFVRVDVPEGDTIYVSVCTFNPTAEPTGQLLETKVGDCFGTTGIFQETNDVEDLQTRSGVYDADEGEGVDKVAYAADERLLP